MRRAEHIITADWNAKSSQRWAAPVGGGIGKILHLGKLPVNAQVSAYYNVVRPDNEPTGKSACRRS